MNVDLSKITLTTIKRKEYRMGGVWGDPDTGNMSLGCLEPTFDLGSGRILMLYISDVRFSNGRWGIAGLVENAGFKDGEEVKNLVLCDEDIFGRDK